MSSAPGRFIRSLFVSLNEKNISLLIRNHEKQLKMKLGRNMGILHRNIRPRMRAPTLSQ